jgi:phage regulator Rha-like protein
MKAKSAISVQRIERLILVIRGNKVMLDTDLAELYGVETRVLKQAVRRNKKRFPDDFMFELTKEENQSLRSQSVILKRGKHSKYLPFAFTEEGVAMLSSVLNSERAIEVNIEIMRAFVRVREMLGAHRELATKLKELENRIQNHDEHIKTIFQAIQQLITPSEKPRRRIGFEVKEPKGRYGKRTREKQA